MSLLVQWVADDTLASRAIQCFGGGYWSHMAIHVNATEVIDARSDWIGRIPPGVRRRPTAYLDEFPRWVKIELPASESVFKLAVAALENEVGKPYDNIGIWAFATCSLKDRNWRERTAWFCDELAAYVLELAHILQPIMLPLYRLTPGAVANMCQQVPGAKIIASKGVPP